jgi:hypothetical protein
MYFLLITVGLVLHLFYFLFIYLFFTHHCGIGRAEKRLFCTVPVTATPADRSHELQHKPYLP